MSRRAAVAVVVVAAVVAGCAGAGPQWSEGPGWRLSGSPTTIPPPPAAAEAKPEARASVMAAPKAAALAPPPAPPRRPGQPLTIVVQPGETLTGLAARYRTSLSAIMAANNLSDPRIAPGQQLVIPGR